MLTQLLIYKKIQQNKTINIIINLIYLQKKTVSDPASQKLTHSYTKTKTKALNESRQKNIAAKLRHKEKLILLITSSHPSELRK